MARFLTQTLLRHSTTTAFLRHKPLHPPPFAAVIHRHRSDQTSKPQLIEIDLDSSSSSSPSSSSSSSSPEAESEASSLRRLEDMVHRIIVQRSTPDWLPFIPGSSFWVPPQCRQPFNNVLELVGKLANPITEEEGLSVTTVRGWPCSDFFIGASASIQPVEVEVEVNVPKEVKVSSEVEVELKGLTNSVARSKSEDEEG